MNGGHQSERQNMAFVNKWSLSGGYFVLFHLKCDLYLQGGLYSEVVFNTGLNVSENSSIHEYQLSHSRYNLYDKEDKPNPTL